ncbi:MAG: hypothetical protein GY884_12525 [Proteobacteria bacterium]|nr:hypothetical protein [Pseudomonadota bacterium]
MLWALFASGLEHTVVDTQPVTEVRDLWCDGDDVLVHDGVALVRPDGTEVAKATHTGHVLQGGAAWVRWTDDGREIGATTVAGETIWTRPVQRLSMTHTGIAIDVDQELAVLQLHTNTPRILVGDVEVKIREYGDAWLTLSPDGRQVLLASYQYLGVASTLTGETTVLDEEWGGRVAAWDAKGRVVASEPGPSEDLNHTGDRLRKYPDGWANAWNGRLRTA